ncbi:hypothetical protein M2140_001982 [Clostridiales Family XIII bacterium PM5-7]
MSYYDDLKVSSNATHEQIVTAYERAIVNETEYFVPRLKEAFDVIGNEENRKVYDKQRYYETQKRSNINVERRIAVLSGLFGLVGGIASLIYLLPFLIKFVHPYIKIFGISLAAGFVLYVFVLIPLVSYGQKILELYGNHLDKVNDQIDAKNKELYDVIMK